MKRSKPLYEGMRAGDLNDLLLPLISVDEYVSTIDDQAVAIGFYVHDEQAANDLNRFLQKSPVAILSSEVSPAPDQHGYFIVFIELMDNERLAENMQAVLKEIAPLCGIDHWKMHVRNSKSTIPFTPENFSKSLRKARSSDEDRVLEFLTPSLLSNAILTEGRLHLETATGQKQDYQVVDFAPLGVLSKKHFLHERAMGLDFRQIVRTSRIETMLGEGWVVSEIGDLTLFQNSNSEDCLLLSEHEPS